MRQFLHFLIQHWHFSPFLLLGQFEFDFGGLVDILDGFLQAAIQFIIQLFKFIWNVLVYSIAYIFQVLSFVGQFFYRLFQDVANAFKWIWTTVIKGALTKLVDIFVKVRTFLQKIFFAIISWLQKARRWFDWAFNKFVKPMLNLIQHVRQVLTIFRLLGFAWAKRLDALLAKIQQDILKVYTQIRADLNMVISWLQIIVDPTGILRRNPLFAAILRSAPELRNALLTVEQRPLTGGEMDAQTRDRAQASTAGQKQNFTQFYSQGNLPPDRVEFQKQFNAELDALANGKDEPNV